LYFFAKVTKSKDEYLREEVKQRWVVAEPFHKDLYANDYFKDTYSNELVLPYKIN
jgi:hypothetical protein